MTSMQAMIDRAAAKADKLPLPRIVAGMLGAATAFFCLAMPPRLVDGLMNAAHLPDGLIGRLLFTTILTLLAGWVGWRAMTAVSNRGRARPVVRAAAATHRPAEVVSAEPAPALRRGDAHPDAPARRPIFAARDLGRSFDELGGEGALGTSDPEPAPVRRRRFLVDGEVLMPAAEPATPADPEPVTALEEPEAEVVEPITPAEPAVIQAADEPFDLVEPVESAPEPVADMEPEPAPQLEAVPAVAETQQERPATLASLMARFESGLDRLDGEVPSPPETARVTPLNAHRLDTDEALREAIAALQRMAARQR